jgi:hypothetical protein
LKSIFGFIVPKYRRGRTRALPIMLIIALVQELEAPSLSIIRPPAIVEKGAIKDRIREL